MFVCVIQREGECLCIYFVYERGKDSVCMCVHAQRKSMLMCVCVCVPCVGGMVYVRRGRSVCVCLYLFYY